MSPLYQKVGPYEIQRELDGLTPQKVIDYADAFPFRDPTVVTLGPNELKY